MGEYTPNINLYKPNPITDANDTFNIETILNENWDKIDTSILAKLLEAKGYTDTKITELINAAPGALDTLKELADALGNDENFATTVTNLIGTKASQTDLTNLDATFNAHLAANTSIVINAKYPPAPLVACKADGATDDTVAAQAIVDYAHINKVKVYFPSGTYKFSVSLNIAAITQIECSTECTFDFTASASDGVVLLPGYHTGRMIFGTIQNATNGAGLRLYGAHLAWITCNFITNCHDNILLETDATNLICSGNVIEVLINTHAMNGIRFKAAQNSNVLQQNKIYNNLNDWNTNGIVFDAPAGVNPNWQFNIFECDTIFGENVNGTTGIICTHNNQVNNEIFICNGLFGGFGNGMYVNLPASNSNTYTLAIIGSDLPASQVNIFGASNRINIISATAKVIAAATVSNSGASWNSGKAVIAHKTRLQLVIPAGGLAAGATKDFYMYHAFVCGTSNNVIVSPKWSASMVVIAAEDESKTAGVDGVFEVPGQIHIRVLAVAAVAAGTYDCDVIIEG
jgi:hypothetical protein